MSSFRNDWISGSCCMDDRVLGAMRGKTLRLDGRNEAGYAGGLSDVSVEKRDIFLVLVVAVVVA